MVVSGSWKVCDYDEHLCVLVYGGAECFGEAKVVTDEGADGELGADGGDDGVAALIVQVFVSECE